MFAYLIDGLTASPQSITMEVTWPYENTASLRWQQIIELGNSFAEHAERFLTPTYSRSVKQTTVSQVAPFV